MNLLKRMLKISESEAHSALDKLENPIRLTEQGIRDMKKHLEESLKAFAEVKAMAIRAKRETGEYRTAAQDYEKKAMQLLKRAEAGHMDATEADRLATEALNRKQESIQQMERAQKEHQQFQQSVEQLDQKIKKLRSDIAKWENELKTLKARQKVGSATKTVNKQMAQIDTSSTVSMLERMKDKVAEEEALADAYGEMANESKSLDDEIDSALNESPSQSDELAKLKARLKSNND